MQGGPEHDIKLLRRVRRGKQVCTYCDVVTNRNAHSQPGGEWGVGWWLWWWAGALVDGVSLCVYVCVRVYVCMCVCVYVCLVAEGRREFVWEHGRSGVAVQRCMAATVAMALASQRATEGNGCISGATHVKSV